MTSKHASKEHFISDRVGFTFKHRARASGAFAVLALSLAAAGCAQESTGKAGTGGAAPGTGGSSSAGTGGGAPAGTGGTTTGTGGSTPGTGTGGSTPAGTGGSSPAGTGGATNSGTGGASAGTGGASAGTGGAAAGTGGAGPAAPVCGSQLKGAACTSPTDACAKNCGPKNAANLNIGSKALTCMAGLYAEGTCDFPAGDMTCFKVTATTAACPAATISGGPCTAAPCAACSGYTDSGGVPKVGYCHCVNSKWTCGSTKEWPCQAIGASTSAGGTGC